MQGFSRTAASRRPRRADAFAAAYGLIGACATIVFLASVALLPGRDARTAHWVEHSLEVLVSTQQLTTDVTAAIATQRRVLLDGSGEHAARFALRKQTLAHDLASLRRLVADSPSQSAALDHLAATIDQRIALLQATVDRVQGGLVAQALDLDRTYRTDPLVQRVWAEIEAFTGLERALLQQRLAAAKAASLTSALTLTACVCVLIATLVTAGVQRYRRRMAQAQTATLAASEARLRETFEQVAVGMAHVGLDGRWLRVNAHLCRMLGYGEDQLMRRTFQELTHPEDLDSDLDNVHQLLAGRIRTYSMEKRYIRRDRQEVWGNLTVSLVRDTDGAPSYFISVVEDISARKAAESAARERWQDFQTLADNMPSLCWMARGDGHIYWYNSRWYEYTGTDAASQQGWQWQSVHDPDVLPEVMLRWTESLLSGTEFEMTFPLRGVDGTFRPFLTRVVPVRDDSGAIERWLGVNVDISAQVATERELERLVAERTAELATSEEQLRKSEMHYRVLAENSIDMVSRVAADGTRVYISPAGRRLHGVPDELIFQRGVNWLTHPDDCERLETLRRDLLSGAIESETVTYRILNPERGELWAESNVRALHDLKTGAPDGYISVTRDITERRRLEAVLQHGQKMEAIGRIAAGVAHDFNNVLQSVISGLELTLDDLPHDREAARFARVALGAARRGAALTHQLLSYARKQMLRPQPLDLAPFLQDLCHLLGRTLGPDIAIDLLAAADLPPVLVDAAHLQTALLNLAINARHAMPGGGRLSLEAQTLAGAEAVGIAVVDTGCGMDEATLRRATEPFFTTKGLEGTGLGLSMVHGFAEQSGGRLAISSTPGIGTTVRLELPTAVAQAEPALVPIVPTRRVLRLLLVDDEPDVLVTTGAFLERSGMEVVRCSSGDEALARIGADERVDLVVTDYAMPGLNGADLIVEGRAMRPGLAAVIISGFADIDSYESLPDGVRVLHKPYPRDELAAEIERALHAADAARVVTADYVTSDFAGSDYMPSARR